jgi:hypothetical protein
MFQTKYTGEGWKKCSNRENASVNAGRYVPMEKNASVGVGRYVPMKKNASVSVGRFVPRPVNLLL